MCLRDLKLFLPGQVAPSRYPKLRDPSIMLSPFTIQHYFVLVLEFLKHAGTPRPQNSFKSTFFGVIIFFILGLVHAFLIRFIDLRVLKENEALCSDRSKFSRLRRKRCLHYFNVERGAVSIYNTFAK